jgi:membrane-associated phospholipid phosphatase
VSIVNSQIYSNTATTVRAHVQSFPSPHGKMADALALILACATATDASVNYRECVLQRP